MEENKFEIKSYLIELLQLIFGTILMAVGISLFLLPNKLSSGGFTGIATVFYYLFKWKVGTVIFLLNLPLFILSYFKIGKDFFFKSLIGTLVLSISVNYLEVVQPITNDKFLDCIFGGIIIGIGNALILRVNGSTGGTEIVTGIIRAYAPKFKASNIIRIFDISIVALNVIVFKKIDIGLYSAIAIYMSTKMVDLIFEGTNFNKMMFIISEKYNEIASKIQNNMERGTTGIYSKGMYANKDRIMLLCVVSRNEVIKIRQIVNKIDPEAFIIISNVREAFGEGFKDEKI